MRSDRRHTTTVNKIYQVIDIIGDSYYIIDDENERHSFDLATFNKKDGYFSDFKQNRKNKLDKLYDICTEKY
jgi:hypothetical protein